jgi:hypothetical protein
VPFEKSSTPRVHRLVGTPGHPYDKPLICGALTLCFVFRQNASLSSLCVSARRSHCDIDFTLDPRRFDQLAR